MPFICPECSSQSLRITAKIELPPDSRSDEITLQIVRCSRCRFAGIAIYEESRRGATESFHHTGYHLQADDLKALSSIIKQCPKPGNARCTCSAHRKLRSKNASGRWNALDDIELERSFQLLL